MEPRILNKQVAIVPFKKDAQAEAPKAKGLDFSDVTATKIITTQAAFDSEQFKKGDTLFFRSDVLRIAYVQQKLNLNGVEFALVPEEIVVGFSR